MGLDLAIEVGLIGNVYGGL